ncbi:Metal-dependent hydrolase, endonuclease/exonuclease/phosphatase family [Hydrocarboniphaga daqingensis]|jgi:endonuclease/exonuclease/phosphatase family metal-dependent hydrolase|uniref:Metal-dependent hydrolase, endonuclease/exonuclease/phosphatase family n=1 Tax=Hydrocarboniphaga daqingensis TaxID=490188 RepID=A0A1M5LD04_9GAMM|nr:endonuclease/exonuclease/phosphatase family protein [Hydrocarboniphaga daqingensis]SHG62992.1 Metal-dependent hydrolase, endonuclease/exonuclease/phosphatase family [Hydrocarboniphaga daqingensis]
MEGSLPLTTFKVLTLNTHKGFTVFNRRFMLHDLREAVRGVGADVVFLQEVLGQHELHSSRQRDWPQSPQYEFLADTIWGHYSYGRNAIYPDGHHGNAVLSKFPITSWQNRDVSIAGPERRGLLHCVLRVPQRDLDVHVICAHLGLMEQHRRQQLQLMCKMIHQHVPATAPLVIAGDFNDWRVRAGDLLRDCGLVEAFASHHGREARTFPARWPLLRLDRIYTRNVHTAKPVVLHHKPWSHLSDHAALALDISV